MAVTPGVLVRNINRNIDNPLRNVAIFVKIVERKRVLFLRKKYIRVNNRILCDFILNSIICTVKIDATASNTVCSNLSPYSMHSRGIHKCIMQFSSITYITRNT